MTYEPASMRRADAEFLSTLSHNSLGHYYHGERVAAPSSGTYPAANRIHFIPFYTTRPYSLGRWFWLNGATVGTDYVQIGIYDLDFNLFKASPRTLSAGTVNQIQYANPGIHGTNVTSGGDITDQDTYTTASVTLKAGVLYLMAVENSHATDGVAVSSIDSATGGYPTFTSRSTTTYNSTNYRTSIWSAVPTEDWTGTLRIQFGASSGTTGCVWALNAFYHVDTATNDGIVQNATGTGNSTTPLATLGAYGSANNVGVAAFGAATNNTGAPTSTATKELSDSGIATPAQSLQTAIATNDTTMDYTITSAQWGACAVELKSLGTGAVIIPAMRGYLSLHCSGTTATFFRDSASLLLEPYVSIQSSATSGFPQTATPATAQGTVHVFGITSRVTP